MKIFVLGYALLNLKTWGCPPWSTLPTDRWTPASMRLNSDLLTMTPAMRSSLSRKKRKIKNPLYELPEWNLQLLWSSWNLARRRWNFVILIPKMTRNSIHSIFLCIENFCIFQYYSSRPNILLNVPFVTIVTKSNPGQGRKPRKSWLAAKNEQI